MSTTASTFSDAELVDYSREHVLYEARMLFDTGSLLLDRKHFDQIRPDFDREVTYFAVIESFAMHARTLIAFFYPDSERKDDVSAQNFFSGNVLPSTFPPLSPVLAEVRSRASKEIGHLTTKRIAGQPPEKNWPVLQALRELHSVLVAFVRGAPASKIDSCLERYVSTWKVPLVLVAGGVLHSTCSSSPSISTIFS
jgi:hypothetical protein